MELPGYNRVINKCNQENTVKDVIASAKRERAEDIQIMREESVVGEHQENGKE